MKRKQWFAAGVVALLFMGWNLYIYSQSFSENAPSITGNEFVMWMVLVTSTMSLAEIFGMIAIVCFVCGFMEKKEEKK